jgi:hypothetical protein
MCYSRPIRLCGLSQLSHLEHLFALERYFFVLWDGGEGVLCHAQDFQKDIPMYLILYRIYYHFYLGPH